MSGRNAEKRAARYVEKVERAGAVEKNHFFTIGTPKIHRGRLIVNMLANRRLRQRGVRS